MISNVSHKLRLFRKTDLFKTSFWNGIATLIKMAAGVVSNKIVAVFLGPSGVALLGQFVSFTSIISTIASTGSGSGITKYIAEYREDEDQRKKFISTGFIATLVVTLICSTIVFAGANYFCLHTLNNTAYRPVFYLFGGTLLLFSLNSFLIAVLNGFKEFKKIIWINVLSSLFGLALTIFLTVRYGISGTLSATVLSVSVIALIAFLFVYRSSWYRFADFIAHFDQNAFRKLLNYMFMSFVSIFAIMYIQLAIRTYLIEHLSITEAGYWQGIVRISELFLSLITTTLGIYYLPRLSEIKHDDELRKEILKGYQFLLPITVIGSIAIYLLREFIIDLLFTADFKPMMSLFFWQLLGNIFKIASWLIAFLMLARAMTRVYIITEILFGILLYTSTVLLTKIYGLEGATIAYCLNYFIYLLVMIWIFRKILFRKN